MNATIREATPEDQAAWARLRSELWPHCPPERHRLEIDQLLAGNGLVAIACHNQQVIGFAEASIRVDHVEGATNAPVPYLEGWYVAKSHRRRGIGRALLSFVEQWARNRGYIELASDAEIDNMAAIQLHAALGFREVSKTVHFLKPL